MGNITLGRYIPLDSPIHKMDPRAKILGMLLMLVAIFFPAGWIGYAILFAAASCAIILAKLSPSFIWKAMKPMLYMLVFLLVINTFFLKTGTPLFTIGSFTMYSDAVFQTLYIAVRLLLMVMITTTLTATTKPLDMTLGIEDLLKPNEKFIVPYHEISSLTCIALRFIPDLID